MSDLTTNKILGAALGTALFMVGLAVVTPRLFEQAPPNKAGYAIAVAAEGGAGPVADVPPDWGTVLKTADPAAGEAKTAACKACHAFDPSGANNIGPGLFGVLGRKPGSHPGFSYSPAMTAFGAKQPIWDYEHIYEFLAGPQKYVDGTKMTFIGLKDKQDRINIIAYLHTLGSNLPIPAPAPATAAAKPGAPATSGTPAAGAGSATKAPAAAAPASAAAPAKSG